MGQSSYVQVDVTVIVRETEAAFLIEVDGEQYWCPKSQVESADTYEMGDQEVTLSITEWWAKKEGLA